MLPLLVFIISCVGDPRERFVSLELGFSADSASVPSRSLVTYLRIGIPEQRYGLMLDYNSTCIELDHCQRDRSRTFNIVGPPNDLVLLEEEEILNPELRGSFRLPVEEHCGVVHNMRAQNYYDNCLSERCNGIIGMSPFSSVWEIFLGAYTLSLESLHLGRSNPFFHQPPSSNSALMDDDGFDNDDHVVVDCNPRAPSGLCEFEARIGGIDVVVDFHTHDSFIYLPHRIYSLYMSSIDIEDFHGSHRLNFSAIDEFADTHHHRHTKRDSLQIEPHREERDVFHDRLSDARERIADRSIYYRNSLHRFTMSQWLPLVVELRGGTGALVLDSDLLVHSPSYANSYAGVERSASEHFFSESAVLQQTILMKPHPTEPKSNRVSIGNGILRRYTLHVDLLHHRMLIEERVIVEHLTWIEQLVATILFTYFLGSVTYSLELLTPLSLGIGHRKAGTDELESNDMQHKRISSHSLREAIFFVVILVVPPVVLARLPVFVPHSMRYAYFYVWAWTTLAVNGICLLANLYYSLTVARGNRPAAGTFLWRSFRVGLSRAASAEHLVLLGIFCISLILRREGLGTPIAAVVGAITIANGVRQLYLDARFKLSLWAIIDAHRESPIAVRRIDLPRRADNKLWGAYVVLVLFLVNTIAPAILFAAEVFWIVTKFSVASSILITALSVCAGLWVVNQYGAAEMRRDH
jgi:hypothetical protein